MSTSILNGIPKALKKYLKNLDDYDDPVFILIRVDQDIEPFVKKIDTAIESVEPYSSATLLIENDLYFASVD